MFKKLLVATAAMAVSATTFAGISLSGLYEGTLDSHGTYAQDIHTTMKGTSGASSVTVVLDKDFSVDDMWVESTAGVLTLKIGDWSGDDPDVTKIGVSTTLGAYTNEARETTASITSGGVSAKVVHNKVTAGHNSEVTVGTTIMGLGLEAVMDRNAGATNDNEFSVSRAVGTLGTVKGTWNKTDAATPVTTKTVELTRGIWTGSWKQIDSADATVSLKAKLLF
jgi:cytochrome c2